MSDSRAAAEPYTTSFETEVERIDGTDVWLDESFFYAESGGQPADRGRMGDRRVVDVQADDEGGVRHTLDEEPAFKPGQTVVCHVDRARRLYCMRAHTASHVLYGAARRVMDDLGYGGFDIGVRDDRDDPAGGDGDDKVRVDFLTSTDVDDDVLLDLEELANQTVWESRDVTWTVMPAAEARALDDIAFNDKTEEGVFGESDDIRVVTVGNASVAAGEPKGKPWDVAACGGTHVRNTREIGTISVLDRSNPGEGMTRVEFTVGPAAIANRIGEKRALLEASRALGTHPTDVPAAVGRLQDDVEAATERTAALLETIVSSRIDAAEPVDRGDDRWLICDLGDVDVDANDVEAAARAAAGDRAAVVVLVGESGGTFVVAAAGDDAEVEAGDIVTDVTDEFGGGGGGSPRFAQGGGIDADPETMVDWLRN